jgi:hypothetical protein
MTLAAVIVLYFLSLGGPILDGPSLIAPSAASPPARQGSSAQDAGSTSGSQTQTPPAQNANPTPGSPPGQTQNSARPAKPSSHHRRHHKNTSAPDCSSSPTALKPVAGGNPARANHTQPANNTAGDGQTAPAPPASRQAAVTGAASATEKPCPPPRKVVKNGGSDEPTIELKGNTTAEQASQERSTTDQLTAATQDNLKKISERPLTASQQETVSQVKEFLEKSKKAVAAGDLQLGNDLATKAHLLSDELTKP